MRISAAWRGEMRADCRLLCESRRPVRGNPRFASGAGSTALDGVSLLMGQDDSRVDWPSPRGGSYTPLREPNGEPSVMPRRADDVMNLKALKCFLVTAQCGSL